MRLASAPALAIAILLAVAGVAAAGGGTGVPTDLKIRNSFPAFHGKVKSPVPECQPDRRVKLFKQRQNGTAKLLGRTDSGSGGKWTILVDPLKSGAYYAKAKRHIVPVVGPDKRGVGPSVVCEPDFSRTIVVD